MSYSTYSIDLLISQSNNSWTNLACFLRVLLCQAVKIFSLVILILVTEFYDILEQFSFTPLVNTPTHIHGHIFDVLCVIDSFSWSISPKATGELSDHQAIMFIFIFPVRESCKFQSVSIRKVNKINVLKFDLIRFPNKTAGRLSRQYFNTLRNSLDKHASIKRKNIRKHAETGFMNCDILKAKRLERK